MYETPQWIPFSSFSLFPFLPLKRYLSQTLFFLWSREAKLKQLILIFGQSSCHWLCLGVDSSIRQSQPDSQTRQSTKRKNHFTKKHSLCVVGLMSYGQVETKINYLANSHKFLFSISVFSWNRRKHVAKGSGGIITTLTELQIHMYRLKNDAISRS